MPSTLIGSDTLCVKLFKAPVFVTEQNPKALGTTVAELDLAALGELHVRIHIHTNSRSESHQSCGLFS